MTDDQTALQAENELLREFFDAWVFLHRTLGDRTDVEDPFRKVRREKAATMLTEAALKVSEHIKRNTVPAH